MRAVNLRLYVVKEKKNMKTTLLTLFESEEFERMPNKSLSVLGAAAVAIGTELAEKASEHYEITKEFR